MCPCGQGTLPACCNPLSDYGFLCRPRAGGRTLKDYWQVLRDWSLITGRGGGYKTGGGGACEVYLYEKGEGRKTFSHAEGGAQQVSSL